MEYHPVTDEIVEELVALCGASHVIYNDPPRLEPYSRDEIPGTRYRCLPEAVVGRVR